MIKDYESKRKFGTAAARIAHQENFFRGYRAFVIGIIGSPEDSPYPPDSPQDISYREGAQLAELDLG